jgi:predicted alpha/beta superfamily hydrolase
MNIRKILVFGLFFVILTSLQAQEKNKTDSLVFVKVHSKVLKEERKIVIHLPLNYFKEPTKKYPVMYVLDAGKLDFDISDRLFTLSSIDIAPECIVIGILNNKGKRDQDLTPPFMRTDPNDSLSLYGKADVFFNFIKEELFPLIDTTYRTTHYRTISGHSRAGLFVLYTYILQPDLFNARFCYSTPAWRFDNLIIKKLESSIQKNTHPKKSYLFFSVGANENEDIKSSFHTMNKMLKTMKSKYLYYESELTLYADHQSNPIFSSSKAFFNWSKYFKINKPN